MSELTDRITRVLSRELLAQLPDAIGIGDDLAPSRSGTINLQHVAAAIVAELDRLAQSGEDYTQHHARWEPGW